MDPHARPRDRVLTELGSGEDDLFLAEAGHRLKEHGPNELTRDAGPSPLAILALATSRVLDRVIE